jgi:hypothetical protein
MAHKKKDWTGETIGSLKILEEISHPYENPSERRKTILKFKCLCVCGNIFYPYKNNVTTGKTTHCTRCVRNSHLLGKKIGCLLVISRCLDQDKRFNCICDCGRECVIRSSHLTNGLNKCCEICRYPKKFSEKPEKRTKAQCAIDRGIEKHEQHKNLKVGNKFGYLKVINLARWEQLEHRRKPWYKCKCKCGNFVEVRGDQIGKGVLSCGCLRIENIPRGEKQGAAKLTNSQANAIREMKSSGLYTGREIASIMGVTETVICRILLNKAYVTK